MSQATSPAKRPSLIPREPAKPTKSVAEIAGGATAECVAVVCCCPCGLVNLLVLTVVKLPAGLCRRAVLTRKKRRAAQKRKAESECSGGGGVKASSASLAAAEREISLPAKSPAADLSELENDMWPHLFGNGFWRSPSQSE